MNFYSGSLLESSNSLLNGSIFSSIDSDPSGTFLTIRSPFLDEWYNFVVPLVGFSEFEIDRSEELIRKSLKEKRKVSYYIHSSFTNDYGSKLRDRGYVEIGSEVFMLREDLMTSVQESFKIETVDGENLSYYIELSKLGFPDWENNEEYSVNCLKFDTSVPGVCSPAFLINNYSQYVSAGAILYKNDGTSDLAYIHNTCTHPDHRRKGYFNALVSSMCSHVYKHGISKAYAIVEEKSPSYYGFRKLGFQSKEKFYLFSRS